MFLLHYSTPSRSLISSNNEAEQLAYSFSRAAQGDAIDAFVAMFPQVSSYYDRHSHFGKYIVLVNGSGTGKSKMVSETRKKVMYAIMSLSSGLYVRTPRFLD